MSKDEFIVSLDVSTTEMKLGEHLSNSPDLCVSQMKRWGSWANEALTVML